MAAKIIEIGGDVELLGKRWVKFLTRHTRIKEVIRKPPNFSTVEASTQEVIDKFYMLFENI